MHREIARRNKAFAAASPEEKRVLIAKDVIAQINSGRFTATRGAWVRPFNASNRETIDLATEFGSDAPLRELVLSEKVANCNCCALGAMFMSCTLYNNQTTAEDFERETHSLDEYVHAGDELSNGLNKFFGKVQLRLIEAYFEGGHGAFDAPFTHNDKIRLWEEVYPSDKARLKAIMQNIVDNHGTFKP